MKNWSHGFWALLVGNCHKCMQNEVWKVWLQKEFILVGFWLGHIGWIGFLCLGSKIGEKVKSWFFSNIGRELSKMHPKIRCQKFGYKRNWYWLGFGLTKLGGLAFCALVTKLVKKWSHGFWAILVGKCHKCIQNEVWNVWLQKELILVGFWLSQVGWIGFLFLGRKIGEKVKSWLLSNLGGEVSQMYAKWGVRQLVAKGIDLGWVLPLPSWVDLLFMPC